MKKLLIIICIALGNSSYVNAQSLAWGAKIGGSTNDGCGAHTLDSQANMYVVGVFSGTADFDPGAGVTNLTSIGLSDMFVCKITTAGGLVWVKQYGGIGAPGGLDITLDATGNIYITGSFRDTADFDPGPGVTNLIAYPTTSSFPDAFVCKLDGTGNLIWAKGFGGMSLEWGKTIKVDALGNVYTCGHFAASVDFNPGAGDSTVMVFGEGIYIHKLDAAGNFVWVRQLSQQAGMEVTAMGVDVAGNFYCAGDFQGPVDFDPGPATYLLNTQGLSGSDDIFACKLTPAGDFVWAKQMGSDSMDRVTAVGFDAFANIYIGGYFEGISDFDPDTTAVFNLIPSGSGNISNYVCKLDSSGDFKWAIQYDLLAPRDITSDINNNIYIYGSALMGLDADPGAGIHTINDNGPCIIVLNQNSNFVAATSTYGSSMYSECITTDQNTNVYISGSFLGSIDLDPGPGTAFISASGNNDGFVWKLSYLTGMRETAGIKNIGISPNPVLSTTSLAYSLTSDESITIQLLDMQGRLIKAFITNAPRMAGSHKELLSFGNDIAAGNYVLTLENAGISSPLGVRGKIAIKLIKN